MELDLFVNDILMLDFLKTSVRVAESFLKTFYHF